MRYTKPGYLVKFLDKEWATKMLDGEIMFRTIESFRDASKRNFNSDYEFKGDMLSGLEFVDENDTGYIDFLTLREKIYCMSLLEFDVEERSFLFPDKRMRKFGDTAVIILDPVRFLKTLVYAICDRYPEKLWVGFKNVEYGVKLSGESIYDEFCKADDYSYQKEFRIVLDLALGAFKKEVLANISDFALLTFPGKITIDECIDSLADELIIDIGDIRDYALLVSTDDLIQGKVIIDTAGCVSIPEMIPPRNRFPTFFTFVKGLP